MSQLDPQSESSGDPDKEPKVIKRYTNRKLYDTVESRYVTLDEIAQMVKGGMEVKVIDNRSKDDLTSVTLAQIIFEEEKKKSQMPLSVLRHFIRHPGESLSGFIQKEVSPRVASIREEAESRLGSLFRREEGPNASGNAEASTAAELLKASQRTVEDWQRKMDERIKHVTEGVVGNLPLLGRDMQTLRQRLEALEAKLDALDAQDPRPPQSS
ncbi:MAG TPA: polyhydroxyalkanoate synthesis regulator DNA-binding domain-containing protein [Myxococcaceae bacterium]|nr:polyhydroxyalkanoate synthesis regulator DNA-binding domain-containing protein [Myxococcaceae bacterium]